MADSKLAELPIDVTSGAHESLAETPTIKPASPEKVPLDENDFDRQLPSLRNLDESFFHNRVQSLFDRLKFDIDGAKVHIVRVDGRSQGPMANSEIRRRHADLDRLHVEISSTF